MTQIMVPDMRLLTTPRSLSAQGVPSWPMTLDIGHWVAPMVRMLYCAPWKTGFSLITDSPMSLYSGAYYNDGGILSNSDYSCIRTKTIEHSPAADYFAVFRFKRITKDGSGRPYRYFLFSENFTSFSFYFKSGVNGDGIYWIVNGSPNTGIHPIAVANQDKTISFGLLVMNGNQATLVDELGNKSSYVGQGQTATYSPIAMFGRDNSTLRSAGGVGYFGLYGEGRISEDQLFSLVRDPFQVVKPVV